MSAPVILPPECPGCGAEQTLEKPVAHAPECPNRILREECERGAREGILIDIPASARIAYIG